MSVEQVSVEIMKRQFTFGTPGSEKETPVRGYAQPQN